MKKIKFAGIKEFFKGKSFLGAMCLSVAAVGVAVYLAYDSALGQITTQDSEPQSDTTSVVESSTENYGDNTPVGGNVTGIPKDDNSSSEESDVDANRFILSASPKYMPIDGDIINPYSFGELVKSETLGVWKTHDGIDIAAPLGTEVKAASNGEIAEIKDDALWGICVIIDHGDGYETHYYGMDKALSVAKGDKVEAGQIIGKTAAFDCEAKLAPHLHFGVKKNGEWVSPEEYIG